MVVQGVDVLRVMTQWWIHEDARVPREEMLQRSIRLHAGRNDNSEEEDSSSEEEEEDGGN